jgi:hypothetical protein
MHGAEEAQAQGDEFGPLPHLSLIALQTDVQAKSKRKNNFLRKDL